jgi:hypothetical protein
MRYNLSVGFSTANFSTPVKDSGFGISYGFDVEKDIKKLSEKFSLYGTIGVHLTNLSAVKIDGKYCASSTSWQDDETLGIEQFTIPIHIGATYKFKKCSIFADLGPNISFVSNDKDLGVTTKSVVVGAGYNLGVKFKRFAIIEGLDCSLSKYGEYTVENKRNTHFGEKFNLKSTNIYVALRWTLGKIKDN